MLALFVARACARVSKRRLTLTKEGRPACPEERRAGSFSFRSERSDLLIPVPLAEERRPHSNLCRAFLNRNFEVVAHPHGKHGQRPANAANQAVTKLAQFAKIGSHTFRIVQKRWNRHQPQ